MYLKLLKGIFMKMVCIDEFIEQNLTEKRKKHVYGVRDTAVRLAGRFGGDVHKAELAALYHDMFKCISQEEMNEYVRRFGLDRRYLDNMNLAHGKVAAEVMKSEYHITDTDLINAVSFHTTGREGMSVLEKIIYLADAIEPGRSYPGVEKIREAAETDLDRACILSLSRTAEYVLSRGEYLDEDTEHALEYLKTRRNQMDNKETALFAASVLDNKKAQDIVCIDISSKASFADYFVLASGNTERQVKALADEVDDELAKKEIFAKNIEGQASSGWILMDYGDVIINIFTTEMRDRYNIEKVWGDCEFVELDLEDE